METMPCYDIIDLMQHPFIERSIRPWGGRPRRPAFILRQSGCIEWDGALNSKGYPIDGDGLIHRQAWSALVGPIPPDHHVHHICKNKRCIRHIACLLDEEHMEIERRTPKLSEWAVRDILARLKGGESVKELAIVYNVSPSMISKIRHGRRWKSVVDAFHYEATEVGVSSR